VRFALCEEDTAVPPRLALIDIEPDPAIIWLLAPTPARLSLAEHLLRERLGGAVGVVRVREFLPPSSIPRWRRIRTDAAAVEGTRTQAA
jgi:hypothetical protein